MSHTIQIRKGLDLPLVGAPVRERADAPASPTVALDLTDFVGLKFRLLVAEGDTVRRGAALVEDKKNTVRKVCAPAAGRIQAIQYGPRRAIERLVIERAAADEAVDFGRVDAGAVRSLSRDEVLERLCASGLWASIRQRPFSRMADPSVLPKAIFVNGMNTAPFLPDLHGIVPGHEAAFQAGLDALTRLTTGPVHLCLAANPVDPSPAVVNAQRVTIHHFSGPHPAGNTSVHIHHIDPIRPHDIVWTVRGAQVIQIGRLLLEGTLPAERIVALGGSGVRPEARRYYRMQAGAELAPLLQGRLIDEPTRLIRGDVLSGAAQDPAGYLAPDTEALHVVPERAERTFLGWMGPGLGKYSLSRTFLSTWLQRGRRWAITTQLGGAHRAMILTGLYDQYVPMRIMTDFLLRAVLAHDTDEAVQLGLLETDPEDFALCAFACPSKVDVMGIIRRGLEEVESEGI